MNSLDGFQALREMYGIKGADLAKAILDDDVCHEALLALRSREAQLLEWESFLANLGLSSDEFARRCPQHGTDLARTRKALDFFEKEWTERTYVQKV